MVDVKLTAHLAKLSKISFSEEELERITAQMQDIIALMDKISDFQVTGNPAEDDGRRFYDLREDVLLPSFPREDILKNAEGRRDGYFTVMKVVE